VANYVLGEMGFNSLPEEQQALYLSNYYHECADARLLQMAEPVTVSYSNERFLTADIYCNFVLRMPLSWTKPLTEWEYDEVVVLSDRLVLHSYDYWVHEIHIKAQGDFTGDGIPDLLVHDYRKALKGSVLSSGLMVLVRTEEGGRSSTAKWATFYSRGFTPAGSIPTGRRCERG
jgi:hypothetical protein